MKISTKFRALLVFLALALCLAGCEPGGQTSSPSASSGGSADAYTRLSADLYQICYNQPETLASTMSCFPSLLQACGIQTNDPLVIDDLLSTGENGGELQEQLLFQLQGLLDDPATEISVGVWSGRARLLGMETIDPEQPLDPSNVRLFWYEDEVDGQIFGIAHALPSGDKEFGYFYLPGGFQRLEPIVGTSV